MLREVRVVGWEVWLALELPDCFQLGLERVVDVYERIRRELVELTARTTALDVTAWSAFNGSDNQCVNNRRGRGYSVHQLTVEDIVEVFVARAAVVKGDRDEAEESMRLHLSGTCERVVAPYLGAKTANRAFVDRSRPNEGLSK